MSLAPITNTTLEKIAEKLKEFHSFAVCGHERPDGDCLGSGLALVSALKTMGKEAWYIAPDDEPLDYIFDYLPGFGTICPPAGFDKSFDCFVAVDVPLYSRMGQTAEIHRRAPYTITIDHHEVDNPMSDLTYCDPDSPATALLIWELSGLLGVRNTQIATCCYSGLVMDTGCFNFSNTNKHSFECAAEMVGLGARPDECAEKLYGRRELSSFLLESRMFQRVTFPCNGFALSSLTLKDFEELNCKYSDSEPLVDVLRKLNGVNVCCLVRETTDSLRASFRSMDGTDVRSIAQTFGGGGHVGASGATLNDSLEEALQKIAQEICKVMTEK